MKRTKALQLGLRKYESDTPCAKNANHGRYRYTTSAACVACVRKAADTAYWAKKRGGVPRAHRIARLPVPEHEVLRSSPIDGKFFTGRRCRRGHLDWRYAVSGNCVACTREHSGYIKQHALNVIQSFRNLPGLVVWTDAEPPPGLPGLIDRRTLGAAPTDHAPCFLRFHDTPGLLEVCRALGMVPIDEHVRTL